MTFDFVVGVLFGWWFAPMFADITKKIWEEFKQWRKFR
jgi:hypothetical protein